MGGNQLGNPLSPLLIMASRKQLMEQTTGKGPGVQGNHAGFETKAQGTPFQSPAIRHFHLVEKIQRGLVELGLYRGELTDVLTTRNHDLE